jgi:threonine synthase
MDIQVSSNFERLLFEAGDRDAGAVRSMMAELARSGSFAIGADTLRRITADFSAGRADEPETVATIRRMHTECGRLVDPHTAVGIAVAGRFARAEAPMVSLATAHPAKFPDAVEEATGQRPPLPARLAGLASAKESYPRLANDAAAAKAFIESHARAIRAKEKA